MPTMYVPFSAAKRNNVEIIGIKKNLLYKIDWHIGGKP